MKQNAYRLIESILIVIGAGGVCVYNTVQRNNIDFQVHPVASILGDIIPGIGFGFIYYWVSGRNARRKQKKLDDDFSDNASDDNSIQTKLTEQIKNEKAKTFDSAKPETNRKTIGLCPKCKSELFETKTGYYCGAFDCNFKFLKVPFSPDKQKSHAAIRPISAVPPKSNYTALLFVGVVLFCLFLFIYETKWQHTSSVESGFSKDVLKGWHEFRSDDGKFLARFPSKPEQSEQSLNTASGVLPIRIYQSASDIAAYTLTFIDFPDSFSDPNSVLDSARDGCIRTTQATLLYETVISLSGYPGRELKLSAPNGLTSFMRIYLVQNRLYTISSATKPEFSYNQEIRDFLDSFKVL
jgi:hypothetical protein